MRDRAEDQMTLALIRHGETRANRERRYLGKTDDPLSKEGMEMLRAYKEQRRYPDVERLFISPMRRCRETAGILYPALEPVVIPEWEEIDFGRFEYRNYEELKDDSAYQEWLCSGGTLDFPEGESRKDFVKRCKSGFARMCEEWNRTAGRGEKPVPAGMIVHGGTIMSLLSAYGGRGYFDSQVPNGGGFLCRLTGMEAGKTISGDGVRLEITAKIGSFM